MRDAIDAFHRQLQDRHATRTARTYRAILSSLGEFLGEDNGSSPSRDAIDTFLARPLGNGQRRSPATRNQELAAIRSFTKFGVRHLGWPSNAAEGIPFAREASRDPAVLTIPEVRRLFEIAATDTGWRRARNLAVLALLSQNGLRVHELVGLDTDQVDVFSVTLVAVRGKGGSVHDLPMNAPTVELLCRWLDLRPPPARPGERALLLSSRGTRLSTRGVQHLVRRLRDRMGSAKRISPHTFRHSVATTLILLGQDLATVGSLLRHEDPRTTIKYVHLVDSQRRAAVGRLAVAIPPGLTTGSSDTEGVSSVPSIPLGEPALPSRDRRKSRDQNRLDVQHALCDESGPRSRPRRRRAQPGAFFDGDTSGCASQGETEDGES